MTTEVTSDEQIRWSVFGEGSGAVEFCIIDAPGIVLVTDVSWIG